MKPLFSKRAALIAMLTATPFVVGGSYFYLRGSSETFAPYILIDVTIGLGIFLLGSPLTLIGGAIILWVEDLIGARLSAVPFVILMSLIFVSQWIIWSQLVIEFWRRKERKSSSENQAAI